MALADKRYTRMYSTTGNDSDKVDSSKITRMESKFTSNEYLDDDAMFEQQGMLIVQMQKLMEEFDEVRRHITNDVVGQAGADGADGTDGSNGRDGAQGPAGNTYGSTIKINPIDFITNDDVSYNRAVIEDDVSNKLSVRVAHSSAELFTSVFIPEGKTVTHVDIYASSNVSVTVYEVNLTTGARTTKGSGTANRQIALDDGRTNNEIAARDNNYIAIKVNVTSTAHYIYGGLITIS